MNGISCKKEYSCENCRTNPNVIVPNPAGNQPPIAIAFYDSLNHQPPGSKFLSAKYSTDPDGTIVGYQWRRITGANSPVITNPTNLETVISNLLTGIYEFELTVTDNAGLSARDTVTVSVTIPPVIVDVGPDQTITLPLDSTYLDATSSFLIGTPPPGTSFGWRTISGPLQYPLYPQSPAGALPASLCMAKALIPGLYVYAYTVTLPGPIRFADTVRVTVVDDPLLRNTVTYHNREWTYGDPSRSGQLNTFIVSSQRPDLFTPAGPLKPFEVSLKPDAASPFSVIPFRTNAPFTWNAAPNTAWIITVPNNPSVVGRRSDLRIRFL